MRSIQNNVYAVRKYPSNHPFSFLILIIGLLFFLLFLSFYKVEKRKSYQGIYHCEDVCYLETAIPLEEIKKAKPEQKIVMEEKSFPLKIIDFGEIDSVNATAMQYLEIEIPDLSFYENQTVDFHWLLNEQSLLSLLWNSLKGGDENVK